MSAQSHLPPATACREISSLQLAPGTVEKLLRAGFRSLGDVDGIPPVDLAQELKITPQEALKVLHDIQVALAGPGASSRALGGANNQASTAGTSVRDLVIRGKHRKAVITFCREIDNMLGGGVPRGELTEVCGTPGVGKTQFGMQLAVDIQIPPGFGGVGGQALYIDTEGSLTVERLSQMCAAVEEHLKRIARNKRRYGGEDIGLSVPTQESLLGGIHVWRLHDHIEQLAAARTLPDFLKEHPEVKLVVMDSVAFHFRHAFQDMSVRTRLLSRMAQQLNMVAQQHALSVVLVNQMTTKVVTGVEGKSSMVPALGESWAHAATNRVLLFWNGEERFAELLKSPRLPRRTVRFSVTASGIRDSPEARVAAAGGRNNAGSGSSTPR
ncbi:unnamed protein product, partial [Discosporangium mesarthrocarpum]